MPDFKSGSIINFYRKYLFIISMLKGWILFLLEALVVSWCNVDASVLCDVDCFTIWPSECGCVVGCSDDCLACGVDVCWCSVVRDCVTAWEVGSSGVDWVVDCSTDWTVVVSLEGLEVCCGVGDVTLIVGCVVVFVVGCVTCVVACVVGCIDVTCVVCVVGCCVVVVVTVVSWALMLVVVRPWIAPSVLAITSFTCKKNQQNYTPIRNQRATLLWRMTEKILTS